MNRRTPHDRRLHPHFPSKLLVRVQSLDGASRAFTARDMSLGGLRLEVPVAGMLQGDAPFQIKIPVGHESVLSASAVVRSTTVGAGERDMVHLAFLDRSAPFHSALAAVLGGHLLAAPEGLDGALERLGGQPAPGRRRRRRW